MNVSYCGAGMDRRDVLINTLVVVGGEEAALVAAIEHGRNSLNDGEVV